MVVIQVTRATGDDRKGLINAKGIKAGDDITVIATRGEYGGTPQLSNGFVSQS